MNIFFLTSDLGASDAAEQLALLATALPRDRFALSAGVLGQASGVAADALRTAGVPVAPFPIRGLLDFSGMRRLRRAVAEAKPAVIHTFGAEAVCASRLVVSRHAEGNLPRLVASAALEAGGGVKSWLTAHQLNRGDRVIATGLAQGERYRRLRVRGERLSLIPPAVASPGGGLDRDAFCREVSAPRDSRFIFACGPLDSTSDVKEVILAFDILRYVTPALRLVLPGGSERAAAEQIGRALEFDDYRIHFCGTQSLFHDAMRLAEVVWVICERDSEQGALRAMASGKPVVAFHTPELAEIIEEGVTGSLVSRGDRALFTTKSQTLLTDPNLAARMGEAGRVRAEERFSVARMAEMYARVYQELADQEKNHG